MTRSTEQHTADASSRTPPIEAELTIYTALENRDRGFGQRPGCRSLVLNLSQVAEMDSAGLQLLLRLKCEPMS
jgi:anti-anti-sigma regulatory factor